MNLLFISYDLEQDEQPGKTRNYTPVHEAINELGCAEQIQKSVWYVFSTSTAQEAYNQVFAACENKDGDKVLVINCSKPLDIEPREVVKQIAREYKNIKKISEVLKNLS